MSNKIHTNKAWIYRVELSLQETTDMDKIVFNQVVSVGCGLDVHKETIVATIRKGENDFETKEFASYTSSLTG